MILRRLLCEKVISSANIDWSVITRTCSWSVYKNIHMSSSRFKKKTQNENKTNFKLGKHKQLPVVDIWKDITVQELAVTMGKDVNTIFSVMEYVNDTAKYRKPNSVIENWNVIEEILKKMRLRYRIVSKPKEDDAVKKIDLERRDPSKYFKPLPRPPVVTIMGHVDHGKTTLLDTLRNANVVESEFGGITQHIGAFSVLINNKDRIAFLDTPGHAAFCAMRNRGAQCTDIVVLVVAADDGVMEQTVESIKMAKEANVPIIVAINKIDKPQADVERTKRMLVQYGVQVEDCGGEVQVVPISALKGLHLDTLMDAVLVQAELMDLKADYSGPVEGVVIESCTDPHRGKLCTLLVQCGTLKKGAILVAGTAWCKVRSMFNEKGETVQEAPPSTPVEVIGWRDLPSAGDVAIQVESERRAHGVVELRKEEQMKQKQEEDSVVIKDKMEEHNKKYQALLEEKRRLGRYKIRQTGPRPKLYVDDRTSPRLCVLIKGDVDGSVEAILDVLDTYSSNMCELDVVHYGVGPVSPNDVTLAQAFSAIIYTFNTKVLDTAQQIAVKDSVPIKPFNVIYKLIDSIKSEMNKLLPERDEHDVIGEANVLQEFLINEGKSKVPVAGCRCTKGCLKKSALFKLVRGQETVFSGDLSSLRHLKDEVDTVKKDVECGVRLSDTEVRFKPGDVLVCYKIKKVPQYISWDPGF